MASLAEDRDAIRDLFARYCFYVDTGAADDWAGTFAEDGEFHLAGGDPIAGRDALRAFAAGMGAGGSMHHVVANEIIDVDGDRATCRASILVMSGGQMVASGRYEDTLRRFDGKWVIATRRFTPDGTVAD